MMTWNDVVTHLHASCVVVEVKERGIVLGWTIGEAVHTQHVDLVEAFHAEWLCVSSYAGELSRMPPVVALEHNVTLAIGSVAAFGSGYLVRHVQPLAILEPAYLDQVLRLVAYEAARLRADGLADIPTHVKRELDQFTIYAE
jgi:hypothetical protein